MAIAVPFLLTAAGVSTTAVVITSVAFAVTGVNDKINKAAENVFGKDLVQVANIAGAVYGAFNGGFDMGDGLTEAADLANTANAADMALAGDPMAAVEAANLADAGNAVNGFNPAAASDGAFDSVLASSQPTNVVDAISGPGAQQPTDLLAPTSGAPQQPTNYVKPVDITQPGPIEQSAGAAGNNATASQTITPTATSAQAAGSNATASLANQSAANQVLKGSTYGDGPVSKSFYETLLDAVRDPKTGNISNGALMAGGNIVQGAFGGYSAAKMREQQAEQYREQVAREQELMARQARLSNLGTAGWRQTQ